MSPFGDDPAWPVFAEACAWEDVQAELTALELSDGLPLVPPTERRLAAMLEGVAEPDRAFGLVPPLFGALTPKAVAYNCVMAGCVPAELPVVLTGVEAALAPDFNLLGLLTTTGTPAVALCVHGPVADRLGVNSGINCLGPGVRANAAIGRAVALVLRNVGGARAETGDMATMGQPGKYGFCFAEGAHPLVPPLPERRGVAADAVTVLGVSGTIEVLPLDDRATAEDILKPIAAAMIAAGAVAGSGRERPAGEQVFLLPPELADGVVKSEWDLGRMQAFLFEASDVNLADVASISRAGPVAAAPDAIQPIVTGGPGVKMTFLPLWAGGSVTQTRALRDLGISTDD